jgi:hypothetical protein
MELKKGRGENQAALNAQLQVAKDAKARQDEQYNIINPFVKSQLGQAPGKLSPYSEATYGANIRNIGDTYGALRNVANKQIGLRGWTSAPSGFGLVGQNALNVGQARDESDAYANAMAQDYQRQLAAANLAMGQEGVYDPTRANLGTSNIAGVQRGLGSTLGDVGTGLGMIGNAAAQAKYMACWIAASLFGEHSLKTNLLRAWLNREYGDTWAMRLYRRFGERVAMHFSAPFRPLFEYLFSRAVREVSFGF